jgi:hypothetical protein
LTLFTVSAALIILPQFTGNLISPNTPENPSEYFQLFDLFKIKTHQLESQLFTVFLWDGIITTGYHEQAFWHAIPQPTLIGHLDVWSKDNIEIL